MSFGKTDLRDAYDVSPSFQPMNTIVVGASTTTLDYDYNGNMIEDEVGNEFKYDAWNRLNRYNGAIHYRYDAPGRRNRVTYDTANSIVRDLYYSANWQAIEERDVTNMAMTPQRMQYVWSPVYVDALVTRYRDIDGDLDYEEQLYALADANWNIMALVDVSSGDVVERYVYDPYGSFTAYEPDWSDTRTSSDFDWIYQHQGGRFDDETGLYHFRHRDYSPTLMRWVGQDPIGFKGSPGNLYLSFDDTPVSILDPSGLDGFSNALGGNWNRIGKQKADDQRRRWETDPVRKQAINDRNKTMLDKFDQMKCPACTGEKKQKARELLEKVLNAADFYWPNPKGVHGDCDKWAVEHNDRIAPLSKELESVKECFSVKTIFTWNDESMYGSVRGGQHVATAIKFCDSTVVFLDDGYLGGNDHLFETADVPSTLWPDKWSVTFLPSNPIRQSSPLNKWLENKPRCGPAIK